VSLLENGQLWFGHQPEAAQYAEQLTVPERLATTGESHSLRRCLQQRVRRIGLEETGLLQAYAAYSLLQMPPKRVGFASGCQAFGHRELLGVLRSFGLVSEPQLTVLR